MRKQIILCRFDSNSMNFSSLFRQKIYKSGIDFEDENPNQGGFTDNLEENGSTGQHSMKRVLTVRDLTLFGIAAIIGAGSFSSLGGAVFNGGPGVVILFIITGIACAFTAYCYSEFASRIPVAGSAYTYAYASFGELLAGL